MLSFHQARPGADAPAFRIAELRPSHQRRAIDSRMVLGGSAILLTLFAFGATLRATEVRPQTACIASPVRLALNGQTNAAIVMRGGAACTIAIQTGSILIDDLTVRSEAQHGTVVPRGRTGAVYRTNGKYRGKDSFELSFYGRSGADEGFAVVRVQVTVE